MKDNIMKDAFSSKIDIYRRNYEMHLLIKVYLLSLKDELTFDWDSLPFHPIMLIVLSLICLFNNYVSGLHCDDFTLGQCDFIEGAMFDDPVFINNPSLGI